MKNLIYLIILFNLNKSAISSKLEECYCDLSDSNPRCDCYHFWKSLINSTKYDTTKFIETITNYKIGDYERLQDKFYRVTNKLNQSGDIGNITKFIDIIDGYIGQIGREFGDINRLILEIATFIKTIDKNEDSGDTEELLESIRRLYEQIKDVSKRLQAIDVDFQWENYGNNLELIREFLGKYQKLPKVNNETFKFFKNFDDKLNFLETVLVKYNKTDKIPNIEDYKQFMSSLENEVEDIKNLIIDIIRHQLIIFDYIEDVKKSVERANSLRDSAGKFNRRLEEILAEEQEFFRVLPVLKQERNYWKRIADLQTKLKRIENSTVDLIGKTNNFRNTLNEIGDELETNRTIIDGKLQNYANKKQIIDDKLDEFRVFERDLDELSLNLLVAKESYQQLDRVGSIADLDDDITKLRQQLQIYIEEITKYCRTQDRRS